jgi:hypothetical protein
MFGVICLGCHMDDMGREGGMYGQAGRQLQLWIPEFRSLV